MSDQEDMSFGSDAGVEEPNPILPLRWNIWVSGVNTLKGHAVIETLRNDHEVEANNCSVNLSRGSVRGVIRRCKRKFVSGSSLC